MVHSRDLTLSHLKYLGPGVTYGLSLIFPTPHKVAIIPTFQMKKLRLREAQVQSEWQQTPSQVNLVPKPTFLLLNK